MCQRCKPSGCRRIDKCMQMVCSRLNYLEIEIVASCCGHGKYPPTIILKTGEHVFDLISLVDIPRKRNFYKKDKQGFYFIPEVLDFHLRHKNNIPGGKTNE